MYFKRAVGGLEPRGVINVSGGALFRGLLRQASGNSRSAALQVMSRLTSRSRRVRPRHGRHPRIFCSRQAGCGRMTRGHTAGRGKARWGQDEAAVGHAPGTPVARSCSPAPGVEVGRVAGDRVYIAIGQLTMHGRGQEADGIGMFRCARDLRNRPALDNAAGYMTATVSAISAATPRSGVTKIIPMRRLGGAGSGPEAPSTCRIGSA